MLSYSLKCKEETCRRIPKVAKTKKTGRIFVISNCAVCSSIKSRFIKEQEAKVMLGSMLGEIQILFHY